MSKPGELSEKEFYDLMNKIAKPTFNFMLKRLNKEVLNGEKYKTMDVNHFFNVIISSMASVDTNMIRWMQGFYKIKTNQPLDQQKMLMAFLNNLSNSLKTVVQ